MLEKDMKNSRVNERALRVYIRKILESEWGPNVSTSPTPGASNREEIQNISKVDQDMKDGNLAPHLQNADSDTPEADEYGPVPPKGDPVMIQLDPDARGTGTAR